MNLELLEDSLQRNIQDEIERDWVRTRVYEKMGEECYWQSERASAKQFYQLALKNHP